MPIITTEELFTPKITTTESLFKESQKKTITTGELFKERKPSFFEKEEEAMTNILSIPVYLMSPELREYVSKYRKGEAPFPKTIEELENIAFGESRKVFAPFLGRTALELGRYLKPSHLVTAIALGKGLGLLGKGVKAITPRPIRERIGRAMIYRFGQPQKYAELAERRIAKVVAGKERAVEVGKALEKGLTPAERLRAGQLIKGGISVSKREAPLRAITRPAIEEFKNLGKEAVDVGLLGEETFFRNMGRYMPRLYTSKEYGRNLVKYGLKKPTRLDLSRFKRRKDIPPLVRQQMGEILEPAYPTAKGIAQLSHDVETAKFFNTIASNPEWMSDIPQPGFKQLSATNMKLGMLRGKWVNEKIIDDINETFVLSTAGGRVYDNFLTLWKAGKVLPNPATHMRNMMSNSILLDLSGVGHTQQARILPRALRELATRGKIYQLAKRHGAIGGEFAQVEINELLNNYMRTKGVNVFERLTGMVKNLVGKKLGGAKMARLYQGEEQWFKIAKFMAETEKGIAPQIAAKEAQKWLFNYRQIPPFIKFVKRWVAPFITFTYKAVPRVAETAVKNPLKIYKYYALFNSLNRASAKSVGLSDEQLKEVNENMPEYMKAKIPGVPSQLLMPWRDKYDRLQYLNIEYILPLGMAPEILERGILKGGMANPVFNILAELKSNKDFIGRDIIPVGSTRLQATNKVLDYMGKQLLPNLMPPYGYSASKIWNAVKKRPDYRGRVRGLGQVLAETLAGLKVKPIDIGELRRGKLFDKRRMIMELRKQLFKTLRHRGVSKEEKTRVRRDIMDKIKEVLKK